MKHLSAGDLLRAEVASGSEVGEQCQTLMKEGKLVPTEVTLGLIRKAMSLADQKTFIIDGFPRAVDQGEAFEAAIKPCEFVLFLDCPKETMQERLLKRGETSGRADDNLETIAKRFDTFMEVSMPVMDHFADKVHKVSSVPAPDEVFAEVCKVFEAQGIEPVAAAAEAEEEAAPVAEAEEEAAPAAEAEEAAPAAEEAEAPAVVEEEAEAPAAAQEEAETPAVAEEEAEAPAVAEEEAVVDAAAPAVEEESPVPEDACVIFVLGGPGSGKGTQCERLIEKYGVKHLSAGDLLRAEVASGSEVGEQCQTLMKEGKLVPTEVTLGLIRKAMSLADQKTFIIDGFPRAVDQGEAFEAAIKPCEFVLFLDCPKETMQERLLKRGETSGRADDNLETIAKRFDTFMEVSMPVMDHFADKVHKVSSVPAPDEVFAEVCKVFEAQGIEPVAAAAEAEEEAAPVAEAEEEAAPAAEAEEAAPAAEEAEAPAVVEEEAEAPAAAQEEAETPAVAEEEAEAPAVAEEEAVVDAAAPAVQEENEAPAAAKEVAPSPATPAEAVPAPEPVSVPSQLHEKAPREPLSLVPPAGKPRERFSDYVTAHGVEKLLRDSMRKLNDARPEDPSKYLAEYFSAALA